MDIQEIHSILKDRFGESAVGAAPVEATDSWIVVDKGAIVEVGEFLRDDERLRFDHLNDLCGSDFFEPDEKKAKKFDHDPHVEVVYQLSSVELKHRLKLKVILSR